MGAAAPFDLAAFFSTGGRYGSGQPKTITEVGTPSGLRVGNSPHPRRDGNDVSADRFATLHVQNYFIAL